MRKQRIRQIAAALALFAMPVLLSGCGAAGAEPQPKAEPISTAAVTETPPADQTPETLPQEETTMNEAQLNLTIAGYTLTAELADTRAAAALCDLLADGPVTVTVSNFGGWEKVGELPCGLPADDTQLTAQPGDIMLYTGDNIVLFYGSNTWAYTPLGHIVECTAPTLRDALSTGDTELVLSLTE